MSDSDTIIYLFGTFHAHDGQSQWFGNAVRTAFEESDQLILETMIPESPEALQAALERYREKKGSFSANPPSAGLAAARTAIGAARSAGMRVNQGADVVLRQAAAARGKPVQGLESFESQLEMYDQLPGTAPKTSAPVPTAASPNPALVAFMRSMLAAWNRGDPATFEAVVGAVRAQSPSAYHILFAQRSTLWAGWIKERLEQPGTVFVAVGTGHLVGRDSVQAKLAQLGVRSARVN